ncbi:hypothetical protein [Fibrella arboris]|uniref:hypothetical protein n=1 Tax=Fibrella arboris TaxID=3242486 RepID=UPI003521FCE3
METNPNEYEAGVDQNQGVVGTMARNQQQDETAAERTEVPQLDPNLMTSQSENDEAIPDATAIGEQTYLDDKDPVD